MTAGFFRGAFDAWLADHRRGEELHLVEELEAVYVQVSTTETSYEVRVLVADLGRAPRQQGAAAVAACFDEVRTDG